MRKIFCALAIFAFSAASAQTLPEEKKSVPAKTLFSGDVSLSGYGAPYVKFGRVNGNFATFAGGKGGLIVNDKWVFGISGCGLVHPTERKKLTGETYVGEFKHAGLGYGGGLVEYYFSPKSLFHVSVGAMVGAGGLDYYKDEDCEEDERDHRGGDKFFVAEPEVNFYVNITRFCRASVGASYRFVNGLDSAIDDSNLRGGSVNFALSFGWF